MLSPDKGPDGAKLVEKHEILKKNSYDQTGIWTRNIEMKVGRSMTYTIRTLDLDTDLV